MYNIQCLPGAMKSVKVSSLLPYTGSSKTNGISTNSSGNLHEST